MTINHPDWPPPFGSGPGGPWAAIAQAVADVTATVALSVVALVMVLTGRKKDTTVAVVKALRR